ARYAFVCGRPERATVAIDGLPAGEVHLLGYAGRLRRDGDRVVLPTRPDSTPVFGLRIGD
ncbi:MAG: hypothetical protein ACKPBG_10135, partial [Actinomycetota bacterium]